MLIIFPKLTFRSSHISTHTTNILHTCHVHVPIRSVVVSSLQFDVVRRHYLRNERSHPLGEVSIARKLAEERNFHPGACGCWLLFFEN